MQRRALLRAALAAPPLILATSAAWTGGGTPFATGVASGDPWPDSLLLWTRLAPQPLAPFFGMAPEATPELTWEVAEDPSFRRIAAAGQVVVSAAEGFSAHVEAGGLRPSRDYWYRFRLGGEVSPTGHARTAPDPVSRPERLRFLTAGCQHIEHGWFTAWRHAAAEEAIDFVFHYGDYIYEYAGRQPGQPGGFGPVVRSAAGGKCRALADYRRRYAQYQSDPDLQAAMAAHACIPSFDDHEVENNWAGEQSEADGRSARHPMAMPREEFLALREAAFQAWWEAMPLRPAQRPRGAGILAHRRFRYGRLLDLHVLDTRQYRDDQPCGDVNGPACAEVARPDAQMLGAAQEAWLLENAARSEARWQVLAQQVMLMPRRLANDGIAPDKWDGAPAARQRLLEGLAARGLAPPVVLTGDIHNAWAGEVPVAEGGPSRAVEFVATSITSGGDGTETTPGATAALARNPHIRFFNNRRGYCLHEARPDRLETVFRAVAAVTRPDAGREDRGRFVVEAGRAELLPA
ncbi:alkaline phosphatase D family protein [Siccirubricoccus sp. KC 17139]|uniref:Alkaline phosphatase D family protein n=1 Tax=Siccirubricoccus soli TaxID=2899147 RepID=A0ABT1CZ05_9PROT|nr:alkaline phosphatase D family protein [Siccirubricoccus soli]MCO6414894.1 alkaline phosphatase D family protein [Siccirubricoccus soli]MCP2681024.1 alkaline phosphatase D family protein [Siccirubricoccus soli]